MDGAPPEKSRTLQPVGLGVFRLQGLEIKRLGSVCLGITVES